MSLLDNLRGLLASILDDRLTLSLCLADVLVPGRTARLMEEGRLPNFVRLAREGGFKKLGTTTP